MLTDPAFYAAAIPAVVLLGLSKGGFAGLGVLAVPLMTLVVSPVQAASIVLPILLVQDVVSVWAFRGTWDRQSLTLLLPGAAAGIALGYLLAAYVDASAVELAVGTISVAFGAQRLLRKQSGGAAASTPAPPSSWQGWAYGAASGFTSQIAHAGGPPFQVYMLSRRLPHETFIGTAALFFATVNWLKVPAYAALGQLTRQNLTTAGALFPLAVVSTIVGAHIARKMTGDRFNTVMYVLLVLVGAKLTWDGVIGLSD